MKKKILVVSSAGLISEKINELAKINKNVDIQYCTDDESSVMNNINGINALINCPRNIFSNKILSQTKNTLEWVHIGGAGIEEYLFPEFVNSSVLLTNGKIIQGPEVSDHAIALLLSITRNLNYIAKDKISIMPRPIELRGKNALILGMGGIGGLIAEKLSSFGANIIAVDQKLIPMHSFINEFYYQKDIEKVIPKADIVISAVPSTESSNKIFSNNLFAKMKNGVIFINISRGKIVDTDALLSYLKKDKFLGVGLDVTDPEPLDMSHDLRKDVRVIITPHIAGLSEYNRNRALEVLHTNLKNYILNYPLINIVNKKLGY
jgi:D-2-hydroxyacid dehydrogenase (NADP+)